MLQLKQNNHSNKCIKLNNTLIDLKNRKTLELDEIGKLTEKDVIFDDITYEIEDHVTTRKGELLFQVDRSWLDYKTTTEKCGRDVLKKYLRDNKLNHVYGKVSNSTSKKIQEELQKDKMKKKRNEIRNTLNRQKRRNDTASTKSVRTSKLNIKDHELTAAGTYYTVCNNNGQTEKINHRILIKTHPTQVKKYQEQIQLQKKQLRLRGKQLRGKRKRLSRDDPSNQKKTSTEAGDKTTVQSNQKKNSTKAGDKTTVILNEHENSTKAGDKTTVQVNEHENSMEAGDKTTVQVNEHENSTEANNKIPAKSNKEEHSSQEGDQDLAVSKILRHRTKNGEINYLLQFTDGTEDYAAEKEAKIDCPLILKEYKKNMG